MRLPEARRPGHRLWPRSRLTWLGLALMAAAVVDFLIPVPPTPGHWLNRWAIASVGMLGILGGLAAAGAIAFRRERSVIGVLTGIAGLLWIFVAVGEFFSAP